MTHLPELDPRSRAVVNVSFGERFLRGQQRLKSILAQQGETFIGWNSLPPGSPFHEDTPFAFKAFALQDAVLHGHKVLLWSDSSILPVRPLSPLWDLIERQGYWFSCNLPHGTVMKAYTNGQWTCDSALEPLGITRKVSFRFPHVIATAFGLDLRHEIAQNFLGEYLRLAIEGEAFRGPFSNDKRQASLDRHVLGHRHDQTAASVIAWRLGMTLTTPPEWIVDGLTPTEKTVLEIKRVSPSAVVHVPRDPTYTYAP